MAEPELFKEDVEDLGVESSPNEERKRKRESSLTAKKQKPLMFFVKDVRYDVIKKAGRALGLKTTHKEEEEWDLYWSDCGIQPEKCQKLKAYQKINHFAGMYLIARKNYLGKNLKRISKQFPEEYKFFPKTWMMPTEFHEVQDFLSKKKTPVTLICKPDASCQGKGIFITRKIEDLPKDKSFVVQRYLRSPYLIDDLKFDLRIYVLITCCDPLRIFIYHEGLARFATEKYTPISGNEKNPSMFVHLTNYAINKRNENFHAGDAEDDDSGHKRSIAAVLRTLEEHGVDVKKLWAQIVDVIIKTFLAVQPQLAHMYRAGQPNDRDGRICFELLGFDVIIDKNAKPWLLEVNHAPSFNTDTPLDKQVKAAMLRETFKLLDLTHENKKRLQNLERLDQRKRIESKGGLAKEERQEIFDRARRHQDAYEEENLSGFTLVYPTKDQDLAHTYYKILDYAQQAWSDGTHAPKRKDKETVHSVDPASSNAFSKKTQGTPGGKKQ